MKSLLGAEAFFEANRLEDGQYIFCSLLNTKNSGSGLEN
jgi:hypothetical protein